MKYPVLILFTSFFFLFQVKAYQAEDKNKIIDIDEVLNNHWDQFESFKKSDHDSAVFYLQLIRNNAEGYGKPDWVAASHSAMADLYYHKGQLGEAVYNYLIAAKKFEQIGALLELANVYNSIGEIYFLTKDYEVAIPYFLKAKDIFFYNYKNRKIAMISRNLAICYTEQKDFLKAEAALDIGKNAALTANDFLMLSMIYNSLGAINFHQMSYDSARYNYSLAIQYADSLSDGKYVKASAINNIGEAFLYEKKYKEAENWLYAARDLKIELGDPSFTQSTLNLLGRLFIEQEQYPRAILILESGLKDEDLLFVDNEVGKGLMLIIEALVKANAEAEKSKEMYLNKKFATYSQKLIAYNIQLQELREELETIGKQQVVRLAVEKHSMNTKLGAAEEKNEKFKYAIIIPVFLLICAMISVYLSLRRNARYKKLYAGIEEVLGNRALRKPNNN